VAQQVHLLEAKREAKPLQVIDELGHREARRVLDS
jgi:hypothetical protein